MKKIIIAATVLFIIPFSVFAKTGTPSASDVCLETAEEQATKMAELNGDKVFDTYIGGALTNTYVGRYYYISEGNNGNRYFVLIQLNGSDCSVISTEVENN